MQKVQAVSSREEATSSTFTKQDITPKNSVGLSFTPLASLKKNMTPSF